MPSSVGSKKNHSTLLYNCLISFFGTRQKLKMGSRGILTKKVNTYERYHCKNRYKVINTNFDFLEFLLSGSLCDAQPEEVFHLGLVFRRDVLRQHSPELLDQGRLQAQHHLQTAHDTAVLFTFRLNIIYKQLTIRWFILNLGSASSTNSSRYSDSF